MQSIVVGIDVSKERLDLTWTPGGQPKQLSNSRRGFVKLIKFLKGLSVSMIVLEATGGYHNKLVSALHEASLPLKVVNPRQARDFARSLNRLCKTDKVDAEVLALYGASRELVADKPKDKARVHFGRGPEFFKAGSSADQSGRSGDQWGWSWAGL